MVTVGVCNGDVFVEWMNLVLRRCFSCVQFCETVCGRGGEVSEFLISAIKGFMWPVAAAAILHIHETDPSIHWLGAGLVIVAIITRS